MWQQLFMLLLLGLVGESYAVKLNKDIAIGSRPALNMLEKFLSHLDDATRRKVSNNVRNSIRDHPGFNDVTDKDKNNLGDDSHLHDVTRSKISPSMDSDTADVKANAKDQAKGMGMSKMQSRTLTFSQRKGFINAHNVARATEASKASFMYKLKWNANLADIAQTYVNKCILGHNLNASAQSSDFNFVGENLYISTVTTLSPSTVVESWVKEKQNYQYLGNGCTGVCGHYTQVVWDNTRYVGCGAKLCSQVENYSKPNAWLVVCNYGPGGNYPRPPYYTGTPCKYCPSNTSCVDHLCV